MKSKTNKEQSHNNICKSNVEDGRITFTHTRQRTGGGERFFLSRFFSGLFCFIHLPHLKKPSLSQKDGAWLFCFLKQRIADIFYYVFNNTKTICSYPFSDTTYNATNLTQDDCSLYNFCRYGTARILSNYYGN